MTPPMSPMKAIKPPKPATPAPKVNIWSTVDGIVGGVAAPVACACETELKIEGSAVKISRAPVDAIGVPTMISSVKIEGARK